MKSFIASVLFISLMTMTNFTTHATDYEEVVLTPEAMRIHRSALLVDGHNDFPGTVRGKYGFDLEGLDFSKPIPGFHTDLPRLIEGGVGAQFWAAYVPTSLIETGGCAKHAFEQIDLIKRFVVDYPQALEMAYSADDIDRVYKEGKIASLIGVEGGHAIENSIGVLRTLYEVGARYMTLTHSDNIDWADSATDEPEHGGLTEFGEQVVLEMNRLGMLVDISHVSADTMSDALRVSKAPIIASHSSAFALAHTSRNVPDDVLKSIAKNRGIVMVNFYSLYISDDASERVD
ncbi:dipeptidase, partial [bacterium]|nr:dipeptidase [bacterium]